MNSITTRLTSHTSRAGLALIVISFLLSIVPFQGKNLTTSKERTSAQTEVVASNKLSRKKLLQLFVPECEFRASRSGVIPFSLAEIHSLQCHLKIRVLRSHPIPHTLHHQPIAVYVAETEDHLIA